MAIFGDAAAVACLFADPVFPDQLIHCVLDGYLVEIEDRIAIALLVAGIGQCVQRQRVLLRCRDLLFNQASDDARFVGREYDGHDEG